MPEYELEPSRQPMLQEMEMVVDPAAEAATQLAAELVVDPVDRQPIANLEQQYGVSLAFTAQIVDMVWAQARIAEDLAISMPCLVTPGDGIPVLWLPSDDVLPLRWTARDVRELTQRFRDNYDIEDVPPRTVLEALKHRLVSFIGANMAVGSTNAQVGLLVRVVTQTHGLRIHYSTTLGFNLNQVFGISFSTPVDGYLPPGIYMFGVQGANDHAPRFDNGIFSIPPTTQANLLIA